MVRRSDWRGTKELDMEQGEGYVRNLWKYECNEERVRKHEGVRHEADQDLCAKVVEKRAVMKGE